MHQGREKSFYTSRLRASAGMLELLFDSLVADVEPDQTFISGDMEG